MDHSEDDRVVAVGVDGRDWPGGVGDTSPSGDALPGRHDGDVPLYGALDLGTNSCRLLVAKPTRRGFTVKDTFFRIVRLGEGVGRSGRLSDVAMSRTIDALQLCADILKKRRVKRSRLVTTEACRVAVNAAEFLAEVYRSTGLELEILTRENEAKLAVSGCAALLDDRSDLVLVFDIGGGSSELIWLDLAQREHGFGRSIDARLEAQNCIAAWTSLPVGVETLAEHFGGGEAHPRAFEAMVAHVQEMLAPFEAKGRFRERMRHRSTHLLGTSGTVTTVAGIHLGLEKYNRSRVDGCWMQVDEARAVTRRLLEKTRAERVAEPCIGRDRADLMLAGCAILEAIVRTWPCEHLRVADRGLREGILASMMAEDGFGRGTRNYHESLR